MLKTKNIKGIIGVRRSGKCLNVEFTSLTENRDSKFENNVQMRVIFVSSESSLFAGGVVSVMYLTPVQIKKLELKMSQKIL